MKEIFMHEIDSLESAKMHYIFNEHVKCKQCYNNITRIALGYLYHYPEEGKLYTICFGSWSVYGDGVFSQHCFFKRGDKIVDPTYYALSEHNSPPPKYTIYKEYTLEEFVEIALKEDEDEWSIKSIILNKLPHHMKMLRDMGYYTRE